MSRSLRAIEERLGRLEAEEGTAVGVGAPVAAEPLPQEDTWSDLGTTPAAAAEIAEIDLAPEAESSAEGVEMDLVRIVFLLGRTLIILGGAYLLRAFTDADVLPQNVGILLGLTFALLWLLMAYLAGSVRPRSAGFHGAAAVLVAFPLTWEAAVRFKVVSVETAVAGLAGMALLYFWVSWRRGLHSVPWMTALAGVLTGWIFILTAQAWVAGGLLLVFLAAMTLVLAQLRGDWGLAWTTGLLVDGTVLLLTVAVLTESVKVPPGAAAIVNLALAGIFIVVSAAGFLLGRRGATMYELVQTAVTLAVGVWGGCRMLIRVPDATSLWFGVVAVVLAVIAYAGAGLHLTKGEEPWRRRNFFHLAGVGLVLALVGTGRLLPAAGMASLWSVAAVLAVLMARRFERRTLHSHGALALLVAAGWSGLLVAGAYALAVPATLPWPAWPVFGLIVLLAAAVATGISAGSPVGRSFAVVPLAVLAWGLGGLIVRVLAPILAGAPGPDADAGVLAMVRTAVLSSSAVVLAFLGRGRLRSAVWLAYTVLVLGGFKMALEDFPRGRPATLFVALALYGGALVSAAALARRRSV